MNKEDANTCYDCIHYDICYKIEHYGRDMGTVVPCDLYIKISERIEVVRCKDCKFRGREDCAMYYRCNCGEQHTWETDNDFCSYSERRKND